MNKNVQKWIVFEIFSVSCIIPPNIVSHHVFMIRSLIAIFRDQYILVPAVTLLLCVYYYVLFTFIKIYIKDIDFQGYPAAHFTLILPQPVPHHLQPCGYPRGPELLQQTCPKLFSFQLSFFENSMNSTIFFANENTSFHLGPRQLREKVSKVLDGCKLLIMN